MKFSVSLNPPRVSVPVFRNVVGPVIVVVVPKMFKLYARANVTKLFAPRFPLKVTAPVEVAAFS